MWGVSGGWKDSRSLVDDVSDRNPVGNNGVVKNLFSYTSKEVDKFKLAKAFVGSLQVPGPAYGIQ